MSTRQQNELTEAIRKLALEDGAHAIGFAPVERFDKLPKKCGAKPQDIFPAARTAIAMAIRLPDACMERAAMHDYNDPEAGAINVMGSLRGNMISARISRLLNREGYGAFPVAATIMWRYRPYKKYDAPFMADISHRHMAVGAGLGEFGWNGLFMAPDIGPRCRLATVITDAPLDPTPMYKGEPLCDRCMRCVRACGRHLQCLTKDVQGKVSIEIGGKTCEYANKNLWRCAWTENFAIRDDAPKPEVINETTMTEVFRDLYRNDHMDRYQSWTVEPCWGECLPPSQRETAPEFCDVPKRKKERMKADGIKDICAGLSRKRFAKAEVHFIDLAEDEQLRESVRFYLPGANSIVALRIDVPEEYQELATYLWQQVISFELDLATAIDALGYSTIQLSFLRNRKTSQGRVAGARLNKVREEDLQGLTLGEPLLEKLIADCRLAPARVSTGGDAGRAKKLYEGILTSGDFLEGNSRIAFIASEAKLPGQGFTVEWEKPAGEDLTKDGLRRLGVELGLDLLGVSDIGRLDQLSAQLRQIYKDAYRLDCQDRNPGKGPVDPLITRRPFAIPDARDYMAEAKSLIVIGLEVFKPILAANHDTPSEGLNAYATHKGFTLDLLCEAAYRMCEHLAAKGIKSRPVMDFMKTASVTPFPIREYRHDNFASRFAAVAAGLGQLGRHGMLLTKEFGVRQMCMSILIDRRMEPDALQSGDALCRTCGSCVSACPAKAIHGDASNRLVIDGQTFSFAKHDHNKCDWAKKYSLLGDEGPKYTGSITDVPVPDVVDETTLGEAMKSVDEIQKDYFLVMEPCLVACSRALPGAGRRKSS